MLLVEGDVAGVRAFRYRQPVGGSSRGEGGLVFEIGGFGGVRREGEELEHRGSN